MSEQDTSLQDEEIRGETTEESPDEGDSDETDSGGDSDGTDSDGDSDGMDRRRLRLGRLGQRFRRQRLVAAAHFERCLSPVEAERFFGEYWERKPLLVPRDEEGRFLDLLSIAEVERRVTAGGLRHPSVPGRQGGREDRARRLRGGHPVDADLVLRERPGRAGRGAVRGAARRSCSRRSSSSILRSPTSAATSSASSATPCRRTRTTRPPSAQGFKVHHDTHDVLCLQVEGEKRWLVYPPVLELPLKSQKYSPELGEPGEPVLDVTMRAGDTLYLPRGWLHQAMTSDTASLHLTVGINVATWRDAVRAAVDEAAKEDVVFRRGVRAGRRGSGGPLRGSGGAAHARGGRTPSAPLVRRGPAGRFAATRSISFARSRISTSRTELERRETVIADLDVDDREARLSFEGRTLRLPARVAAELEYLLRVDGPFTAADLPGRLDDESRLVLVRRLVREGLLRIRPD